MRPRHFIAVCAAGVLAAAPLAITPPASADPPGLKVVAAGLVGPLHLAFGPGHSLYVASAFGGTIDKVSLADGSVRTAFAGNGFTPGVDVQGNGNVLFTFSEMGATPEDIGDTSLMRVNAAGRSEQVADMLALEQKYNPDGQDPNSPDAQSNPYSVLALGNRTLVADAAGNSIMEIPARGGGRPLTSFPVITTGPCEGLPNNDPDHAGCDPVPTDLELGPDGYLYVSGLGAEVEGHVYKVDARSGAIVDTWGGFPPLTGIAVDGGGAVYVASLFTNQVFRIQGGAITGVADVPGPTDVEWRNGLLVAGSLDFSTFLGDVVEIPSGAFS